MNKTLNINIAGLIFNIEEKAYESLKKYLNAIRDKFLNEAERDEILADIEARIAELFTEKISPSKQVINPSDIDEIISILGRPEDFIDEEEDESTSSKREENFTKENKSRRLYRDKDNSTVAGVCEGLGYYFGIDPILFKILFVFLAIAGGSGVLLYIILIIVVPEAKTTSEKLEMRGEPVNLENIKSHITNIKDNITNTAKKADLKNNIHRSVSNVAHSGSKVVHIISQIIGFGLTVGSLFALAILSIIYLGNSNLIPFFDSDFIPNIYTLIDTISVGSTHTMIIYIALIICTILPLVGLLMAGIKLLFTLRGKYQVISRSGLIIWVLAVITLFFCGSQVGIQLTSHSSVEKNYLVSADSIDVLQINVMDDPYFSNYLNFDEVFDPSQLMKIEDDNIKLGMAKIVLRQSNDSSNFRINLIKESNGKSLKTATQNAENFSYNMHVQGNELSIAPYYSIPRADKIRLQHPVIEVYVPVGKKIKLGKNINRMHIKMSNIYSKNDKDLANTIWLSTVDGFYPQ
ncbi:PspC domain-containing protein [Crocinitomix catalasitica]|uniref:PspC domain-containing protein n=1 Tax=Crocinitomix catalasitica TaxID=184607 RepID=UPI00047FD52E|nr:PspC domain-containing protein [Crocinitomix catalasitica]